MMDIGTLGNSDAAKILIEKINASGDDSIRRKITKLLHSLYTKQKQCYRSNMPNNLKIEYLGYMKTDYKLKAQKLPFNTYILNTISASHNHNVDILRLKDICDAID